MEYCIGKGDYYVHCVCIHTMMMTVLLRVYMHKQQCHTFDVFKIVIPVHNNSFLLSDVTSSRREFWNQ